MRKLTLALLLLLFLPSGPSQAYVEAGRRVNRKDLAKCSLLALSLLLLVGEGWVMYGVWLVTTAAFATYQYRYVFAEPIRRPVLYEETSMVGLVLVAVNHIAVAVLCGMGWFGVGLHAFCSCWIARTVGRLAIAREIGKMCSTTRREYPEAAVDEWVAITSGMLANRVQRIQEL